MTEREALKLALEALEAHADIGIKSDRVITAIKEALAQPEQEPVAWYVERQHVGFRDHGMKLGLFWKRADAEEWVDDKQILKPLYTTPPQRKPLR